MLAVLTCNAQSVQVLKDGIVIFECSETKGGEVIIKEDPYNGHEYVDLGLPSGLKWATMNVGATKPEEYGDYFAWGETEPYYTEGHSQDNPCTNWKTEKTGYNWDSYFDSNITKYATDKKTQLDPKDDAAHVNWGGDWRMPTDAELTELRTKCSWTWESRNGVNGYKVTGPNNNSIFLPAAGYRYDSSLGSAGSVGDYWSSSLDEGNSYSAYESYFDSSIVDRDSGSRDYGQSVRPVCP